LGEGNFVWIEIDTWVIRKMTQGQKWGDGMREEEVWGL
jgi:hypothetical protein